jgi:hypothetical protein
MTLPSKIVPTILVAAVTGMLIASIVGPVEANCSSPFLGEICTFASDFCPRGFVVADGRLLSINENQALFGLLGTTFGGDGQTTFAIPDLRGRIVVGTGQGTGLPAITLGQTGGDVTTANVLTEPPDPPDYSLSNSAGITVVQGASGSTTITGTLVSGTTQSVSFTVSGLPSGASAGFTSASCSPTCSTTLTITTATTTPAGTFTITVTGSPLGRTTAFTLVVNPTLPVEQVPQVPQTQLPFTGLTQCLAVQGSHPQQD